MMTTCSPLLHKETYLSKASEANNYVAQELPNSVQVDFSDNVQTEARYYCEDYSEVIRDDVSDNGKPNVENEASLSKEMFEASAAVKLTHNEKVNKISCFLAEAITESVNATEQGLPGDLSLHCDQSGNSKLCDTEEEERKLILNSVKHVDCQDFPFDEVLSLEDTVLNDLRFTVTERMRHRRSKAMKQCKDLPTALHQDIFEENTQPSVRRKPLTLPLQNRVKKNRPQLLKSSTWPESEFTEINSSESAAEKRSKSCSTQQPSSKLDSPSFYSSTAIDFSAISHLSEEHDKRVAQENAEKANNNSYISDTTKQKLYGKASQRGNSETKKTRKQSNKTKGSNQLSYTVTSTSFSDALVTQSKLPTAVPQPLHVESGTEGCMSINRRSLTKQGKISNSGVPSTEKDVRRRYSSTPAIIVSSTPIASLQNDIVSEKISLDSSSNEKFLFDEGSDGARKNQHLPAEKQPLPPEGFKISRYPLASKSTTLPKIAPVESTEQASKSVADSDMQYLIQKLRHQLEYAKVRISKAERQAREWKYTAQKTLRAAQVFKAQLEIEKNRANSLEQTLNIDSIEASEALISSMPSLFRRFSDEEIPIQRNINGNCRPRIVSADQIIDSSLQPKTDAQSRKRALTFENTQSKRQCVDLPNYTPKTNSTSAFGKTKSLLALLSNPGTDEEEIDYMQFIESPDNVSSVPNKANHTSTPDEQTFTVNSPSPKSAPKLTNRSVSHDEVRKALRAKVGNAGADISQDDLRFDFKFPLELQNSLDRFLDSFASSKVEGSENVDETEEIMNMQNVSNFFTTSPSSTAFPDSPTYSHSLSDSELSNNIRNSQEGCSPSEKTLLLRRMSSSESNLVKLCSLNETSPHESDFLKQLDNILDL